MINREQFIDSVRHEAAVIKHLYTKVPKDKLDYRPTPGQRSLQELLEYLPITTATVAKRIVTNDWGQHGEGSAPIKEAARKDFPGTMDREMNALVAAVKAIPEPDFQAREVTLPGGRKMKLGEALLNFNLKFMTAYRMQLFLYLKSCGRTELSTYNCWMGMDPPPKA